MDQKRLHERSAPWYSIPSRQIVSVEHPCVIKNVEKGVETLQGDSGISKLLNPPRIGTPASLSLRPEDAMSRPLTSTSTATNNVLLKVTVPKRTGRRRKRGSSEAFTDAPATDSSGENGEVQDASHLQRTLLDNVGKYKVEVVGAVDRTHVFRGMPDFMFSTTASPFASRFREKILPFDYDKLKDFKFDMSRGAISNVDIIPPPAFSYNDVPFNYIYRQNSTIKQSIDPSGSVTTINTQRILRVCTHLVPYDIPTVPSKPRDDCPDLSTADKTMKETVEVLHGLFADRPIWTRRALRNSISSSDQRYLLRSALAYVGYTFRSGPWRDAIVKFGHDPRKSPESRFYQTLMFRILPPEGGETDTGTAAAAATATAEGAAAAGAGAGGGGEDPAAGKETDISHGRRTNYPIINYDNPPVTPAIAQPQTQPTDPEQQQQQQQQQQQTHLFTGQPPLPRDGKMWMVCDITDPILHKILYTAPQIRSVCDPLTDGWYGNVTLAKTRAIMRSKIHTLLAGNVPRDEDFMRLLEFPEHVCSEEELKRVVTFGKEGAGGAAGEEVGSWEIGLAAEVRGAVRTAPGRVRGDGMGWGGLDERINVGHDEAGGDGEGGEEGEHDYDEQDVFDGEGQGASQGEGGDGDTEENEGEGEEEEEQEEVNEEDDDENDDAMNIVPG